MKGSEEVSGFAQERAGSVRLCAYLYTENYSIWTLSVVIWDLISV